MTCDGEDVNNLRWSTAASDSGNTVISYPAGNVAGDLALLYITQASPFTQPVPPLPSGYTNVEPTAGGRVRFCFRVIDGTEAATVPVGGGSDFVRAGMLMVRPNGAGYEATRGSGTVDIPSADVTTSPSLLVIFVGERVQSGGGLQVSEEDMCFVFHRSGNFYCETVDCFVECRDLGATGERNFDDPGTPGTGGDWGRILVPTVSACEGDEGPVVGVII